MTRSLSLALVFGTFALVSAVTICPIAILEPPPGTDVGLYSSSCLLQCFYEQEKKGVCSNGPAAYAEDNIEHNAEIIKFEVLSKKSCAIFSHKDCGGKEVAFIEGPGSVSINTTAVKSVICL